LIVKAAPVATVEVALDSVGVTTLQPLDVLITVNGSYGNPVPTGSVTVTSGSYSSSSTTLQEGNATINVPAGSLAVGNDTLTVQYSGDAVYPAATGTTPVTVTGPFEISATSISVSPGATAANQAAINVSSYGGFAGSVALAAVITSSPPGATDSPTFSFGSTSPVNISGTTGGTATLTIFTTAPTSATLLSPNRSRGPWYRASGATVACAFLLGLPALRRRRRRTILGVFMLLIFLAGGVLSCGGGGNGGAGGGGGNPGTTPGTYVVTLTGTSGTAQATGKISLIVQ
jgi:hypothetical protein